MGKFLRLALKLNNIGNRRERPDTVINRKLT